MTKLEQLYNAINTLKELGLKLPDDLIEQANQVETEIIEREVIPTLSEAIDPVISQIRRELILVVEYTPDEPLLVKITRKRSFKQDEDAFTTANETIKQSSFVIAPHNKSKKTNLVVTFPDGTKISNQFAYQTFCQTIEKIGEAKVASLGLKQYGTELVSQARDDYYQQQKTKNGFYIATHSSTRYKRDILEDISKRLALNLQIIQE
jgi:hypothetical protein